MAANRIVYLAALVGAVVFFWAYREWLSWLLLMLVVFLPWLSLLLSLPAMLSVRVGVDCPETVTAGTEVYASLSGAARFPMPPFRGKLQLGCYFTGEIKKMRRNAPVPTRYCGGVLLTPKRVWVYDYLGLIGLPVLRKQGKKLLVLPKPVALPEPPDLSAYLAMAWKPKLGGGFSENHELRLYRPGDSLRQIHWKLSAKTGKLILREPMEALRGLALLTLELSGTRSQLDRKLGQLLWASRYLLYRGVPHYIQCLTGTGMEHFAVKTEQDLQTALCALLVAPCCEAAATARFPHASWSLHIGGEAHEV